MCDKYNKLAKETLVYMDDSICLCLDNLYELYEVCMKAWLNQGIAEDILKKVPPDKPVTWCTPIVVQPKPRYVGVPKDELEPNTIRACVDLRIPNKYMERKSNSTGTSRRRFYI